MHLRKVLRRIRKPALAPAFSAAAAPPRLSHARRVFDGMRSRDVVSWTAMVSGYIRCGMLREARRLFDDSRAKKNVVTWTAMLSGYVRSKRVAEGAELFRRMPEKNIVSWNTMVAGYAENGRLEDAYEMFARMPERNVVTWNTMMTALAQNGKIDEALKLFRRMPEKDIISWTAMLAGLAQNGRVDEARLLFDEMPERNVVSWNAMVSGYAQNLRLDEALSLFEAMPERDLPSWTSLIAGYVQEGLGEDALKLLSPMQIDGVKPNQATFVSLLAAASDLAGLAEGKQIHQIICKTAFQFSPFVLSALITMYSKCGDIATARTTFDLTENRDSVVWNGIITAHAYHGCGGEAIALFDAMRNSGFVPDGASYVGILSACSHSGLVDLCGRAGRLQDAATFLDTLEVGGSPSAVAWGALLAGCNVHGDARVGKLATKRLMQVEPENAGTYMLMSNIYASAGRWNEAARMRLKMKDKGLKKQPGCSWIEVGRRVHVFVARDKSHSRRWRRMIENSFPYQALETISNILSS